MTKTDEVRAFVLRVYIQPARKRKQATVTIRAGDVADGLKLHNRMPLICGALGALKFQTETDVKLIRREGPQSGANAQFTFEV